MLRRIIHGALVVSAYLLPLLAGPGPSTAAGQVPIAEGTVTVSAGEFDRRDSVVAFPLPPGAAAGRWELAGEAGDVAAVQVDKSGRAAFILKELKAGQSKSYTLRPARAAGVQDNAAVSVAKEGGAVRVIVDGRPVLTYHAEKTPLPQGYEPAFQRGGYIHPLLTPSGTTVTDDYPPNHKHHHGVWAPWTKTEFEGRKPDFWNMGSKTGTVEPVALGDTWGGNVFGGFKATHRFVDLSAKPQPKVALNEEWDVRAYRVGGGAAGAAAHFLFDWQSTQTCASDSPLILPQYHYGGLGLRGHRQWDGKNNSQFLTSEGKDRANGNGTAARWVSLSGKVDGKPAYVAILCAPDNFRAPQPVRLHPGEPFACYAPQTNGPMKIEPGKPYVMRYRFVVGDGEPDKAELERLWNDYANPPGVTVK